MKIKYIKGNLLEAEQKVIVHGCNMQGVMGSGVAKAVRAKYPEAYNVYRDNSRFLGDIGSWEYEDRTVVNAITQESYGRDGKRYVSYDALAVIMKKLNQKFFDEGEVAFPIIGASLGGGNWSIISAIIEAELTHIQPYVYIVDKEWEYLLKETNIC